MDIHVTHLTQPLGTRLSPPFKRHNSRKQCDSWLHPFHVVASSRSSVVSRWLVVCRHRLSTRSFFPSYGKQGHRAA